ncbi:MAG: anti-sigma factor antagonist [Ignavibacteria bacterium]|nr:MAG: anti-sigma factor antagonist [Ignavibacteria bacterium]
MAEFKVETKSLDSVSVLMLYGYLDAHTAPDLEDAFNKLIENNRFKVVINFSNLNYISSAGLGVFMAYVETMRENKGDIKFSNLKPDVYNIFDLLGFPMLYEFYNEESEAVAKFTESENK